MVCRAGEGESVRSGNVMDGEEDVTEEWTSSHRCESSVRLAVCSTVVVIDDERL